MAIAVAKPRLGGKRPPGTRLYAWAILLAGLLTFAVVVWARTTADAPSALESRISEGAPLDHVHALAAGPKETTYVATHRGLLSGRPGGSWSPVPGLDGDVQAVTAAGGDTAYLYMDGVGLIRLEGDQPAPILPFPVQALAGDPQNPDRVVVYRKGIGLEESRDSGQTWNKLTAPGTLEPTAIAIATQNGQVLAVGGLQGELAVSKDGGKSWTYPANLNQTVTALVFGTRRPDRLWAAAGGKLLLSTDLGASWEPVGLKRKGRETPVVIGLSPVGDGVTAVTAEGWLATVNWK